MKKARGKISKFWKENEFLLRPFLVFLVIYLVGISAIILAGVHYADDVARTTYGYAGWNGFSRYVDTVLAHILHADGYLTNIAPLPQLLAIVILAVASVLMICVISGKEVFKLKWTKWIWQVIAAIPLALSPYMLECLSYQYDAPYMAISVLCAVVPLVFRKKAKWMYILAIVVGILTICMTYQAAVGIFLMLVIIVAMKEWGEKKKGNKEILKFVLISAGVFLLTLLVFQKILMKPRDAYASNSLPAMGELIPTFFNHLGQYFSLVFSDFKILWLVMVGLISIFFVVLFVVNSKKNKIVSLVMAVVGGCVIVVLAFAFYAVLDKPLYATRAMYPFGAALAILGVYVASAEKKMSVMRVPIVVLAWCFFVFAFTYGNALKEQNNYRDMVANMVVDDLNEIVVDGATRNIQTTGSIGFSPVILHMPQDYRVLDRLLMPTYSKYVPWMAYKITLQSGLGNLVYDDSIDLTGMGLPVLKETALYIIYGDDKSVLVEFKDKNDFNVMF